MDASKKISLEFSLKKNKKNLWQMKEKYKKYDYVKNKPFTKCSFK